MRKKHVLSCLLTASILTASLMPAKSLQAVVPEAGPVTESSDLVTVISAPISDTPEGLSEERLAQMITKVKQKITIPKEYTIFDSSYAAESSYSKETLYFYWSTEDGSKYINISCDKDANITSFYLEDSSKADQNVIPAYLKTELKEKADAFIQKTAEGIFDQITYTSSYYNGIYQNQYIYEYTRIENGILVPQQKLIVGVDAESGTVERYENASWNYDVEIPEKNIKITEEQAEEILKSRVTMELKYRDSYTYDQNGTYAKKVFLVYEPSVSYLSVDAATGTVYDALSEWRDDSLDGAANESAAEQDAGGGSTGSYLTEAELEKIEELAGLLSKEEAAALVKNNTLLYVNPKLTVLSADLFKGNRYSWQIQEEEQYYWNLRFSRPAEENDPYLYDSYAVVNAKTGEITSFQTSTRDYYDYMRAGETAPAVRYTEEQNRRIFEEFAASQNQERFENAAFYSSSNHNVIAFAEDLEVYGGYYYTYYREYDGIEYSGNSIYGSVDAATGKITSYGFYWDEDIEFERAENILTPEEAYDAFIQYDGFELLYELNTIHSQTSNQQEARLVYQMNISPSYVSPFTGKQLDYNGDVYVKPASYDAYTDIAGHPYERSIRMLADIGTGYSSSKFNPDASITLVELHELTQSAIYVREEYALKGHAKATRQAAAEYVVKLLDLGQVAELKGIYKVDAADAGDISSASIGYAALALGFGILSLDENQNFRPEDTITKAEAADMIIKLFQHSTYIY